jgi:hypothetical protein
LVLVVLEKKIDFKHKILTTKHSFQNLNHLFQSFFTPLKFGFQMRPETLTDLPSDFLIGNQRVQLSAKSCQLGKGKTVDVF